MKITHNKVGTNLNLTDTGKANKADGGKSDLKTSGSLSALGDAKVQASNVNLSAQAQNIKKAKELAMAAPDVREDKVAELQKKIDSGKYNVSAKDIADKMVDEELLWS